ncbi:hypothetical protein INT43_001451 [Umbelopsis isabellina]|uniref:ditrans,polycis-polyprenyl diphosphate synthase [(2E,6E)-farnesyldiphosphate specific] n=1 Tax=Mortierella isabellina TaxID=91625 RepID=A0A8H7PDL6_MORIS|nr:hypothetical protein INT43_001451 [Umbelopsis isabellina]
MSSAKLQKRSQAANIKPPEFQVRSGPAPNLGAEQSTWLVTLIRKFILSCLLYAVSLWTLAKAASSRSWFFILKHTLMRNVTECIVRDKARLTKIPQHLAIIVANEQTWRGRSAQQWNSIIQDICNTCVWSSEVGIHTVSVFESSGFLKRRSAQVQKQLVKAFEDWQLLYANSVGSTRPVAQYKGFKLSIFAVEDGKAHVAQVAKQMAIAVTESGRFRADEINISLVDKWMTESIAEPELALICYGSAHRYIELGGFLPWHMRLTEFM